MRFDQIRSAHCQLVELVGVEMGFCRFCTTHCWRGCLAGGEKQVEMEEVRNVRDEVLLTLHSALLAG